MIERPELTDAELSVLHDAARICIGAGILPERQVVRQQFLDVVDHLHQYLIQVGYQGDTESPCADGVDPTGLFADARG